MQVRTNRDINELNFDIYASCISRLVDAGANIHIKVLIESAVDAHSSVRMSVARVPLKKHIHED